jgi:hypothetical protein
LKLIEGKYYQFKVLKTVNLPDEGDFYMLRHQSGRRLLLPVEPYKNYCIDEDDTIECKVDKINCTGKVFLEPKHPVYLEGKIYDFIVKSTSINDDELSQTISVHDVFFNEINIDWPKNTQKPKVAESIKLCVEQVKKGIPILSIPVR